MSEFKSWEELSVLEQMQCQYWDMYKDAYGVRPRGIDTTSWAEADFESEFEVLGRVIEREETERKLRESEASVDFEKRITDMIGSGAANRATALRWIHEAEGSNGDDEYLCFLVGLPYGYFRLAA